MMPLYFRDATAADWRALVEMVAAARSAVSGAPAAPLVVGRHPSDSAIPAPRRHDRHPRRPALRNRTVRAARRSCR